MLSVQSTSRLPVLTEPVAGETINTQAKTPKIQSPLYPSSTMASNGPFRIFPTAFGGTESTTNAGNGQPIGPVIAGNTAQDPFGALAAAAAKLNSLTTTEKKLQTQIGALEKQELNLQNTIGLGGFAGPDSSSEEGQIVNSAKQRLLAIQANLADLRTQLSQTQTAINVAQKEYYQALSEVMTFGATPK